MSRRVLQECVVMACILFLMCPKRIRSMQSSPQMDFNGLKHPKHIVLPLRKDHEAYLQDIEDENKSDEHLPKSLNAPQFLAHQKKTLSNIEDSPANLAENEPGFDLTKLEKEKLKIWLNGIIPYYIEPLSFDKVLRDKIRGLLHQINAQTGLSFVELPSPSDDVRHVFFINRKSFLDCQDNPIINFSTKGVQKVVLGYDCITPGGLASIVLAIAGVPPQHNAPDRDLYIEIIAENILPDKQYLFQKLKDSEWIFHDVEYDFKSAGHYSFHKHTSNGFATFKLTDKAGVHSYVGEHDGLSYSDVWKIRMLYNRILKSKHDAKQSDCEKLYERGTDFDKYKPPSAEMEDAPSRKKPNKYMGISEETIANDGSNENNNENKNIESNVNADKNEQDGNDDDVENENNLNYKNNSNKKNASSNDHVIQRYKKNSDIDVLVQRSDFQTDSN